MTDKYTVKLHEGELDEDDDETVDISENKMQANTIDTNNQPSQISSSQLDDYFINNDY